MNEAELEEGKMACFAIVNSISKVMQLRQILNFMCEWSEKGARTCFSLLGSIGEKEGLTHCCLSKRPFLSQDQKWFREISLECFLSCSASNTQDLYRVFLSCVGGVVLVSPLNSRKVTTEHLLRSPVSPSCIFFSGSNLPVSIMADLKACVVTPSGKRLDASKFISQYVASELEPEHFFVKKEGDQFYLNFSVITRKYSANYIKMLRELACSLPGSPPRKQDCGELTGYTQNCLSMVSIIFYFAEGNDELVVLSDLLSSVASPQEIKITQTHGHLMFPAELVTDLVSNINFTHKLFRLELAKLNISAIHAAIIASYLCWAPNLHELNLSDNCLYEGVAYLTENLCHVPQLSILRLSRVGMSFLECLLLATSLPFLTELTVLDLSFNSLGEGITEVTQQLKGLNCLEHLNLERTKMGKKEAEELAEALKLGAPKLRAIRLGGNPLGQGVSALVQHFCTLAGPKALDLKDVSMTKVEVDAISAAPISGITTSYHFLNGDPKPESKWPTISPIPETEFHPIYTDSPVLPIHQSYRRL